MWRMALTIGSGLMLLASIVMAEPITIAAADLKAAYEADKRAANREYKRNPLVVFGYFDEVRGGLVHFASETYCSMESRRAKNAMKEMAAGTYIVLAGEGSEHTFRDPSIRNCRLLSDNDPLYVPEPGTATEPAPPPVVEAESEPARESEREQTAGSPELQQSSAEPEPAAEPEPPEAPGLSEASTVTLDLFRELYEFRNDPEFHRIGFSVTGRFNAWMVGCVLVVVVPVVLRQPGSFLALQHRVDRHPRCRRLPVGSGTI